MRRRIFIVGNGGSGKTWLAQKLGREMQLPIIHLDDLHWLPNFAGERPRDERDRLVAQAAEGDGWIMEGIYGSIFKQVQSRVESLLWLDIADEECVSNLKERGQTGGGTAEQFEELLEYTRGYRHRKNHLNSFDAHEAFFMAHAAHKVRLSARSEMTTLLAEISPD